MIERPRCGQVGLVGQDCFIKLKEMQNADYSRDA